MIYLTESEDKKPWYIKPGWKRVIMASCQLNPPVVRVADDDEDADDDLDLRLELDDDDDFAIVKGDYASGKFKVIFRSKLIS